MNEEMIKAMDVAIEKLFKERLELFLSSLEISISVKTDSGINVTKQINGPGLNEMPEQYKLLEKQNEALRSEINDIRGKLEMVINKYNDLLQQNKILEAKAKDPVVDPELVNKYNEVKLENERLKAELDKANDDYDNLVDEYNALNDKNHILDEQKHIFEKSEAEWRAKYFSLKGEQEKDMPKMDVSSLLETGFTKDMDVSMLNTDYEPTYAPCSETKEPEGLTIVSDVVDRNYPPQPTFDENIHIPEAVAPPVMDDIPAYDKFFQNF